MKKTSNISVIIPTCNRAQYIKEAVESALNQTYNDYEIIVVDDGSTDDTKQVLSPYMDKIIYFYQQNKGCAKARNVGIKKARGEYLVFLDSDDILNLQKFEIQRAVLDSNIKVGFVYSDSYVFENNNKLDLKIYDAVGRNMPSFKFAELFFMNPNIHLSSVMFRRECFGDVGLFNESLRFHEDGDMLLRIALKCEGIFSDYISCMIRIHSLSKSLNRIEICKAIIRSSEKILNMYPNFKKNLGIKANRRIAQLRYSLARAYMEKGHYNEARNELVSSINVSEKYNFKPHFYLMILSFGRFVIPVILKSLEVLKKVIRY